MTDWIRPYRPRFKIEGEGSVWELSEIYYGDSWRTIKICRTKEDAESLMAALILKTSPSRVTFYDEEGNKI